MGATPTRITWEGQTEEGESLSSVTIVLPDGSRVDAENVKVTVLQGLDRLDCEYEVSTQGDASVTVDFPELTPAGALVMVELNRAVLPAESGSYGMTGSYVDGEGDEHEMPDPPALINVVGVSASEQLSVWLGEQDWVQAWNSNKFLNLFLNPQVAVTAIPVVSQGWVIALGLVLVGFPLAIPIGLMWAFMRMSKNRFLRGLAGLYINIIRGTPLFLQIYIAFFGLPLLGIQLNNFVLGIIVLMMNSSAYMAEIFRAGIQSINKGQFEAARSLGMNGAQTMFSVILPQTVRRVTPTMTSEFILLYKDTSLLAAVGVYEIMMFSKSITAATGNVTPYIIAALFYLIVTIPLTKIVNTMEDRMSDDRPKKKKKLSIMSEEVG